VTAYKGHTRSFVYSQLGNTIYYTTLTCSSAFHSSEVRQEALGSSDIAKQMASLHFRIDLMEYSLEFHLSGQEPSKETTGEQMQSMRHGDPVRKNKPPTS
jgi:hypothetical protein